MKVAIEVKNRDEADAIKRAMADPAMRATVVVAGSLMALPSDTARRRVLAYVQGYLAEQSHEEQGQ